MSYCYLVTATALAVIGLFTPPPYPYVLTTLQIFLFFTAFQRARQTAEAQGSQAA